MIRKLEIAFKFYLQKCTCLSTGTATIILLICNLNTCSAAFWKRKNTQKYDIVCIKQYSRLFSKVFFNRSRLHFRPAIDHFENFSELLVKDCMPFSRKPFARINSPEWFLPENHFPECTIHQKAIPQNGPIAKKPIPRILFFNKFSTLIWNLLIEKNMENLRLPEY